MELKQKRKKNLFDFVFLFSFTVYKMSSLKSYFQVIRLTGKAVHFDVSLLLAYVSSCDELHDQ